MYVCNSIHLFTVRSLTLLRFILIFTLPDSAVIKNVFSFRLFV